MRRLVLVLALLVLSAATWWLRSTRRPDGADAVRVPLAGPAERAPSEPVTGAAREPVPASARDPVRARAGAAAPPPREPTAGELALLRKGCGETGTICGVVLRGLERMGGAQVHLWSMVSAPERIGPGRAAGTWSAATPVSGEFSFTGLAPDAYLLRVEAPDGAHREAHVILGEHAGAEHVVVFGSGCIGGRVLDGAGSPIPGVQVYVGGLGADGGNATQSRAWTDERGSFEVCGLPAAVYWVIPRLPRGSDPGGPWRLALGTGQRRSVRLGSLAGDPRWSGRIVDALDRPVPWVHLLLEDAGSGLWWRILPDEGASFEARLPPGRYRIGVVMPESDLLDRGAGAGELVVGERDVQRDVLAPGVRVDVRFLLDGRPATREVLERFHLELRPAGAGRTRRIVERDGERFVCLGLEPGTHELWLTLGEYRFEAGEERRFPFEVPAGVRTLELEVPIRPGQD